MGRKYFRVLGSKDEHSCIPKEKFEGLKFPRKWKSYLFKMLVFTSLFFFLRFPSTLTFVTTTFYTGFTLIGPLISFTKRDFVASFPAFRPDSIFTY